MPTDRLVAWRVTTRGTFPDAGIFAAATAARAKALNLAAARDAGFTLAWTDLIARRAPEFDAWVAKQGKERGWAAEYVARCVAEDARRQADGPTNVGQR